MAQVLRQSTQVIVQIGPFVDVTDGFTPETGVTLSGADEAELLKANTTTTTDISSNTWAAITGCDGYFGLTLSTTDTNTVGTLTVMVNDDSVCLPVLARFQVIEEAAYDAIYAASASPATAAGVSAVETDTQDIQSRLPAALTAGGNMKADALALSGDTVAADNAEAFFDGTGYAGTNNVIPTVTTLTGHTAQTGDCFARLGAPAGASVSADVAAVKSDSGAIKTQTDKFVFTVANQVDANIQYVNDVQVTGTGAAGDEWGP